jgi:hypothetical protein
VSKALIDYQDAKSKRQLECWSRWVDARVFQRKFLLPGGAPDWICKLLDDCIEKQVFYKLTEKEYNKIKDYEREIEKRIEEKRVCSH